MARGEPPALFTSTSSAPEVLDRRGDDPLRIGGLAHVGRHEHRPLDLRLVPPARDHPRPGADERGHDPGAHPTRAAGHDDHPLAEVEGRLRHRANPTAPAPTAALAPPSALA